MKIKNIVGLCSCKGCKNKYSFDMEIINIKGRTRKSKLCNEHAMQLLSGSKMKSVTFEERVDFE